MLCNWTPVTSIPDHHETQSGPGGHDEPVDRIRIVAIDRHPIVAYALRSLAAGTDDLCLVGRADPGSDALKLIMMLRPDVAVVEVDGSDPQGLAWIKDVRMRQPGMQVIVFSSMEGENHENDCFNAGARGFLSKSESPDKLLLAIRQVAAGLRYPAPESEPPPGTLAVFPGRL